VSNYYVAHAVHRLQKNELINYFLEECRATSVKSLISYRSGRKIIGALRSGEIVWFAPDHDMGKQLSVYAPFFGHPAATLTAPGKLTKMTGATYNTRILAPQKAGQQRLQGSIPTRA